MFVKQLLLVALVAVALGSTDPHTPWSVCATNKNEPYPSENIAPEIQGALDAYVDALNCTYARPDRARRLLT